MTVTVHVPGYCPMGCGETLFTGAGGYLTCSYLECPLPDAVSVLLANPETEHIVLVVPDTFTVQHPLRERLEGELFECGLHRWIANFPGPPGKPGRYRVAWRGITPSTWTEIAS
jgi:hypothetical protein